MQGLIARIQQASQDEIVDIFEAAKERYQELFPDWEINVFSLEKSGDRNDQIDRTIQMLEALKKM